jgi:putative ABC transport system ATP-binding protein
MTQTNGKRRVIDCTGLRKDYRMGDQTIHALDGVDLAIEQGEMVAIIGASGSGKSTLLHILGCLDTPSAGRYHIDGEEVSTLDDDALANVRNRKIGFVFQQFNLLPRSTALENVEMPLFYRGDPDPRTKAVKALERVGLGARMKHVPNQLSGGQRQRVAVARALVTNPTIILADEPTGNLDSSTTIDILKLFQELHEQGATIIVVTHEPEVAAHCGRQVRLRDGKVLSDTVQTPQTAHH